MQVALLNKTRICVDDISDRKLSYSCPVCNNPVIPKLGKINTHHFAHASVSCGHGAGETIEHETTKKLICYNLRKAGHLAEMEVPIREHGISRIADVLANIHGKVVAFEVQCSTISQREILRRTTEYTLCDIFTVWVYGGTSFNTNMVKTMQTLHHGTLFCSNRDMKGNLQAVKLKPATSYIPPSDFGGGYIKKLKKRKDAIYLTPINPATLEFGTSKHYRHKIGYLPWGWK